MDKGTKKLRPFDLPKLFTKTEFVYDCAVAFDIFLLEVVEKVSSLTNHFVHTAAAVVVVVVVLQVFGKFVDSGGENRDLYFGSTFFSKTTDEHLAVYAFRYSIDRGRLYVAWKLSCH